MEVKCKARLGDVRLLSLSILILFVLSTYSCARQIASPHSGIPVPVGENLQRLIDEEDTDGDKKITVDDHRGQGKRGDKKFQVTDINNHQYEVIGTYHLSNLLQELKLFEQQGKQTARLRPERIFENPVRRISRSIRQIYWDGLTRRIDEENIVPLVSDTKTTTVDDFRYVYTPYRDDMAYAYFSQVARRHPALKIKVVRLPEVITPEWAESRNGYHGLLSLALEQTSDGNCHGIPFVVPGGRFNEMYGWDSYFEALGLLEDGKVDLARAMADNLIYEINNYGKILNANRSYYLTRSQPPFLTSFALAVYEHLPKNAASRKWLEDAFRAAIREYQQVWVGEKRLTKIGLSRYYGEGLGVPPEVEPGHFDAVFTKYAKKFGMDLASFEQAYKQGTVTVSELDEFFTHDRSMRESGHDTTYRWADRCADFVSVDLNSLLYKIEQDVAKTIENEFNGTLKLENGRVEKSGVWYERAEERKRLMTQYLWDQTHGIFLDYDLVNHRRKFYLTPVVFYPLWAGLATQKQTESIVQKALPALETSGGLVGSTEQARGELSKTRPARQWDYPYGWAPHQMLAWKGLMNYGFKDVAYRLIYRWLYTITRNAADYNGTIPEKFDVVNRSHQVFAEYGNVGTKFAYITREGFGWMNASYQVGLKLLPSDLRGKLEQCIPPEWVFERGSNVTIRLSGRAK